MAINPSVPELNQTTLDCLDEIDTKKIIEKFVKTAIKLLGADFGFMFWRLGDDNSYSLFYRTQNTPYKPDLPRKHGYNYRASKGKTPYFVSKPIKSVSKHMESLIIIPIFYKNHPYGNIVICFKNKRIFNNDDRVLSRAIGNATAQVLTIHELYFELRNFKNRMDKSLDSIFIFNTSNFRIEYANKGAQRQLGFNQREFSTKTFFEIQPKVDRLTFRKQLLPLTFKRVEAITIETTLHTKKRENIPVELFIQLTDSLDGSHKFLCTVRDLTHHKKAEKEAQKLLRQKDEFFNIASHELKTPVTTIRGFAQILTKNLSSSDSKTKYFLDKINTQVNKLGHLVNELLDVSRIETGKIKFETKKVELHRLTSQSIENLKVAINSHKLSFTGKERFWLRGDAERIERVIINLVTNAVKYSPPKSQIKVCLKKAGKFARIEVDDSGVGIKKDDQHKIFKRFFQSRSSSRENFPGLGLGLYIANTIVKWHKGSIGFKNKKQGTTFFFMLPFYKYAKIDDNG